MLSTINDVDQYLQELTGDYNEWEDEITEDLDIFKNIYNTAKYSESKSVDDKGKPVAPDKPGYKGDDVEVAYIWDTINDVYGIVVNRRFLVAATEHPYRKTVDVPYRTTSGEEKKNSVINMALKEAGEMLVKDLYPEEKQLIISLASKQIELILAAPQKKNVVVVAPAKPKSRYRV